MNATDTGKVIYLSVPWHSSDPVYYNRSYARTMHPVNFPEWETYSMGYRIDEPEPKEPIIKQPQNWKNKNKRKLPSWQRGK